MSCGCGVCFVICGVRVSVVTLPFIPARSSFEYKMPLTGKPNVGLKGVKCCGKNVQLAATNAQIEAWSANLRVVRQASTIIQSPIAPPSSSLDLTPTPSPARPGAAASSATVLIKFITSLPEDKNKGPNIHLVIGKRVDTKTNLILTGLAVDPRGNLVNCASLPMTVSLLVEEKDSGGDYLSFDVPE